MKKQDLIVISIILFLALIFSLNASLLENYLTFNKNHGMVTSFFKFGILATFGEMLGLRIKTGNYFQKGFGLLAKFIVWGILGLSIKLAFIIFATGTPSFLVYLGFNSANEVMQHGFTLSKLAVSFSISCAMNVIYAPIMMTFHKITDIHINEHDGKANCLLKPINYSKILHSIDWNIQWNFVFKKTIPLFWIPAHTITFLLPEEFQVLFAAILSIMLGLILAFATLKSQN